MNPKIRTASLIGLVFGVSLFLQHCGFGLNNTTLDRFYSYNGLQVVSVNPEEFYRNSVLAKLRSDYCINCHIPADDPRITTSPNGGIGGNKIFDYAYLRDQYLLDGTIRNPDGSINTNGKSRYDNGLMNKLRGLTTAKGGGHNAGNMCQDLYDEPCKTLGLDWFDAETTHTVTIGISGVVPFGGFDTISYDGWVSGWGVDLDDNSQTVKVVFYSGGKAPFDVESTGAVGKLLAEVMADQARDGLVFGPNKGFRFQLTPTLVQLALNEDHYDGRTRDITAYIMDYPGSGRNAFLKKSRYTLIRKKCDAVTSDTIVVPGDACYAMVQLMRYMEGTFFEKNGHPANYYKTADLQCSYCHSTGNNGAPRTFVDGAGKAVYENIYVRMTRATTGDAWPPVNYDNTFLRNKMRGNNHGGNNRCTPFYYPVWLVGRDLIANGDVPANFDPNATNPLTGWTKRTTATTVNGTVSSISVSGTRANNTAYNPDTIPKPTGEDSRDNIPLSIVTDQGTFVVEYEIPNPAIDSGNSPFPDANPCQLLMEAFDTEVCTEIRNNGNPATNCALQ